MDNYEKVIIKEYLENQIKKLNKKEIPYGFPKVKIRRFYEKRQLQELLIKLKEGE
jgi:predicted nucleic acid-binding protein